MTHHDGGSVGRGDLELPGERGYFYGIYKIQYCDLKETVMGC